MQRLLALVLALGTGAASAASSALDLDRAADSAALTLDSIIQRCPASLGQRSTSRCVSTGQSVTLTRRALSDSALNLYGAWRSDSDPAHLYNWVMTGSGYLNVQLLPDPQTTGHTLVLLSLPAPAQGANGSNAPAFNRVLRLSTPRMNGADVRALQNRLMDVSGTARGQGGDGWYGPVTAANVTLFQAANGLRGSGVLDQATWTRLFSNGARSFDASLVPQIAAPGR